MKTRALIATIAGIVLVALLSVGKRVIDTRAAEGWLRDARRRLNPSLTEAPELDRISASTAASLFERAKRLVELRREDRGWLAYARALEDIQRGDLILAEAGLGLARRELGASADVLTLEATLAHRRTDHAQAKDLAQRALSLAPRHVRARMIAADLALDADDAAEALRHLDVVTQLEPNAAVVMNRRGLALEVLGDHEGARAAFARATELAPAEADAWINLGRTHQHEGRFREAKAAFDAALRAASADPSAWLGRGLANLGLGESAQAERDFTRSAELATNDAEPMLGVGDARIVRGDVQGAIAAYREAIAREAGDAASWLKLGNALVAANDFDAALRAFDAAIARAPNLAQAYNGRGAALMRLARPDEAAEALARAATLDERDPNPLLNLALLHEHRGARDAARTAWQGALARDPSQALARARLAQL